MNRYLVACLGLAVLIVLTLSGDHYRQRFAEKKQPRGASCQIVELQALPDFQVCTQEKRK